MNPQTSTRKGRTLAMAAVAALATTALASPALVANAANADLTVKAPTKSDVAGYANDTLTVEAVTGVTFQYKLGSGTLKPLTAGSATKIFTAAPATGDLKVTVVATPADNTDKINSGTAGAAAEFAVDFTNAAAVAADKFAAPKPPTVKANKTSTFSDVIIPKVTGVTYTVKQYTAVDAGGTASDVATIPTDGKTALTLTNTTNSVKVTAAASGTGYTLTNEKALVTTEWVFNVKTANKLATKTPADADLVAKDMPGTKDWAEIVGVEGVQFSVGTKKINAKPGATVKVPRAKGATKVEVTATPVTGWAFADGTVSAKTLTATAFTDLTASAAKVKPTIATRTITVAPDVSVKNWQFTGADNKVLKVTIPKGASSATFVAPSAGTVQAVAATGYEIAGGDTAKTGKWAVS